MNLDAAQIIRYSFDGVLAAESAAVSHCVGVGYLDLACAHIISINIVPVHIANGIPVDGKILIGHIGVIHHQQVQHIALPAHDIILALCRGIVYAHDQITADVLLGRTRDSADINNIRQNLRFPGECGLIVYNFRTVSFLQGE